MITFNDMTMKLRIVFLVAVAMSMTCKAKVEMSPLFSDNMVLQQQSEAPVWGKAKAGKKVVVTTSWDARSMNAAPKPMVGGVLMCRHPRPVALTK